MIGKILLALVLRMGQQISLIVILNRQFLFDKSLVKISCVTKSIRKSIKVEAQSVPSNYLGEYESIIYVIDECAGTVSDLVLVNFFSICRAINSSVTKVKTFFLMFKNF